MSHWKERITIFTKIEKLFYGLTAFSAAMGLILLPMMRGASKWNPSTLKWLQDIAKTPQGAFLRIGAACWVATIVFLVIALSLNIFDYHYRKAHK
jgi:hypothetical protein